MKVQIKEKSYQIKSITGSGLYSRIKADGKIYRTIKFYDWRNPEENKLLTGELFSFENSLEMNGFKSFHDEQNGFSEVAPGILRILKVTAIRLIGAPRVEIYVDDETIFCINVLQSNVIDIFFEDGLVKFGNDAEIKIIPINSEFEIKSKRFDLKFNL